MEKLRCHLRLGQGPDSQNSDDRQERGKFLAIAKLNFHNLLFAYRFLACVCAGNVVKYVTDLAYEFQMECSALL